MRRIVVKLEADEVAKITDRFPVAFHNLLLKHVGA